MLLVQPAAEDTIPVAARGNLRSWTKAVGRLIGSKQDEISEKNSELFQKDIVINNLKSKAVRRLLIITFIGEGARKEM